MSSGLMSCVRENSPPLDVHVHNASGPLSLPADTSNVSMNMTSTPLTAINSSSGSGNSNIVGNATPATTSAEQQKRRRFHPLRNLRRIFRRRTITSVTDTPPSSYQLPPQQVNSNSEKNLRSATLSSISSVVSASSPSSPLTHQQLQDAYSSQSLPKSKSAYSTTASSGGGGGFGKPLRDALLAATGGRHKQQKERKDTNNINEDDHDMYTTTTSSSYQQYHHQHQHVLHQQQRESGGGGSGSGNAIFLPQRQSLGVAVLPSAMSRSFYAERQKLRSVGDSSSQDLDSSGNDSGSNNGGGTAGVSQSGGERANGSGEITDSQRSLSEGRLVDCDYSHDQMSQSHDSVFSESATASSLSIVLKAELADVLRKRRNRPDASDEDLGLPRSPASPQRHQNNSNATNSSSNGVSSSGGARQYKITTTTSSNTTAGTTAGGNQSSEKSSLSLLSINSNDNDDFLLASTANNTATDISNYSLSSSGNRFTRSSTVSSTSDVQYRQHTSTTLSSTNANRNHHSFDDSTSANRDESDFFSAATNSSYQRLSHSAAKHKMAIRPMKKKGGPSRHQRRTLETSIPEANEDSLKMGVGKHNFMDYVDHDVRAKTRSLPPGVNAAKLLEQHVNIDDNNKKTTTTTATTATKILPTTVTAKTTTEIHQDLLDQSLNTNNKRTKIEKSSTTTTTTTSSSNSSTSTSTSGATNLFGLRALTAKATALFESKEMQNTGVSSSSPAVTASNSELETTESGFLRRLIQRNSKRTIASRTNVGEDEFDMTQSEPKKLQISTSNYEVKPVTATANLSVLEKSKSAMSYEQNVEETRKEIKREINAVGSSGLSAMLNTFMLTEKSASSSSKEIQKPKSGAAARQRYLPQDISGGNTLEKKTSSNTNASKESFKTTSLLTKPPKGEGVGAVAGTSSTSQQQHHEMFQSTSIIREITASQNAATTTISSSNVSLNSSSKSEYHFEKKPKIVGLSAFQQKISRSNDSFVRTTSTSSTNTSSNSLETAGAETEAAFLNFEKQRKSVEKSRSFRTYNDEERETSATSARGHNIGTGSVHNNMPSLPDLTLNLRVPCFGEFILNEKQYSSPSPPPTGDQHDKSISLGFEINDNNLVKPVTAPLRTAESAGNLPFHHQQQQSNYTKNIILTSTSNAKSSTPTKLLTPSSHNNCVVPSLSPTNSCNKNISEIEQNIDLIVKSPFISVLRKSTTGNNDEVMVNNKMNASLGCRVEESGNKQESKVRPKHLNFKERTVVMTCGEHVTTPTTAAVPLREKSKEEKLTPSTAAVPLREKSKAGSAVVILTSTANIKEGERKSAPVYSTQQQQNKTNSFKTTRRSSSVLDAAHNQVADDANATVTPTADVPEFMKIQLNRVDPARIAKSSNIVLSKNAKETTTTTTIINSKCISSDSDKRERKEKSAERSASIDDLCMRRLSNESVEITEKDTPEDLTRERRISAGVFEAINKQANKLSGSVGSIRCSSSNGTSNNSSHNNSELPTPKSPTKNSFGLMSPLQTPTASAAGTPGTPDNEEHVVLRTKVTSDTTSTPESNNKLSLQERKRLFMNEEKMKMDRKIEELRQERKKSINEEVFRKSIAGKSEEKLESPSTSTSTSTEFLESSTVILRKKSFSATTAAAAQHTQSIQNGGSGNNNHKDDPTPELMKVFARRSLKIKDEDISALTEKIMMHNGSSSNTTNTAKKFVHSMQISQNVDSDKENQSSSEEKLDKLPKIEMSAGGVGGSLSSENQYHHHTITSNNKTASTTSLNGSVNRNSLTDFRKNSSGGIMSNGLSLSSNHNNNNNNNSLTSAAVAPAMSITPTPTTSTNGTKSFLPPIKISAGGFRTIPIERNGSVNKLFNNNETFNLNNNNNNAFNSNANKPTTLERQSLNIKMLEHNHHSSSNQSSSATSTSNSNSFSTSTGAATTTSKPIERSATVSEFKGIHQRRAEWEQRAKEALK